MALGFAGTALMICEGAALGWGPIFLHDGRGVSLGLAATAVTAYAAGQTAVRLVGDRLANRYGAPRVFRAGGLVAAAGLGLAVLVADPVAAVAGFAVMGAGMSVLLPLAFSAVGRVEGMSTATAVSRFTTFTYTGVLLGPAAVGWAAELTGLTRTLAALLPVLLAVALLTRLPVGGAGVPDGGHGRRAASADVATTGGRRRRHPSEVCGLTEGLGVPQDDPAAGAVLRDHAGEAVLRPDGEPAPRGAGDPDHRQVV